MSGRLGPFHAGQARLLRFWGIVIVLILLALFVFATPLLSLVLQLWQNGRPAIP